MTAALLACYRLSSSEKVPDRPDEVRAGRLDFPYDLLEVHREAVRNPSPRHPA
ncbi:hypothetical protein [Streptomyces sp. NPDC002666]